MIECIRFKSHSKGALLGFADFRLPKMGIEIFGCSVHQKNGRRWVNLPSREYENELGEKKYASHVRFIEQAHYNAFGEQALKAIDKWCEENNQVATPQEPEFGGDFKVDEEVPF